MKLISWKDSQGSHRLMLVIVLTLGLLNFFWGEKIPAGGGFGFDGVIYADMVRNLDSMVSDGRLSTYYAQRILPSAIVRGLLILSGSPMSNLDIIRCFEIYNLTLLLGACWIWKRLADHLSLSLAGRWIGFSGIFINFHYSKLPFYYPVLTDVTALFIAMLLLLFYIKKKPIPLFAATIIGAFAWPVVSASGALLLVFLRAELPKVAITPAPSTFTIKSAPLSFLLKLSIAMILVLSIIGYIAIKQMGPVPDYACNNVPEILARFMPPGNNPCTLERVHRVIGRLLTVLPSLVTMLIALAMLIGSRSFLKATIADIVKARLSLVVLAIAAVLLPIIMVKAISNPGLPNVNSLQVMIIAILQPAEGKFLLPFVTLTVFWGPVMLLLLLYWKAFCVEARKLGPGFVSVIGISLPLGLACEPRFITIAWPFLVLGLVLALESSSLKVTFKYALTALTVLFAQFWMKFNLAPWSQPDTDRILEFPKQAYFMHNGLTMGWGGYSIQLIAIILSALWLYKTMTKHLPESLHKLESR